MRVSDYSQVPSGITQSAQTTVRSTSEVSGGDTNAITAADRSGDQVSLSGVSQLLKANGTDRSALIARLTAQVRSGQYEVPTAALSQSLVSETLSRSSVA